MALFDSVLNLVNKKSKAPKDATPFDVEARLVGRIVGPAQRDRSAAGAAGESGRSADEIGILADRDRHLGELAGQHHLGEVAVAVVLGARQGDGFLQAVVLEVLGHLRGVELRLLPRLGVGVDALEGHANRPERHDEEHDGDRHGDAGHVLGDFDEVQTTGPLREGRGAKRHHAKPGACDLCDPTNLPDFHYCILR